jgi:hypothetical protein
MADYKEKYQEAKKTISEQKKVIKKQEKFIEKLCLKLAEKNKKALFHDKHLLAAFRGEAALAAEQEEDLFFTSVSFMRGHSRKVMSS